jgi:hypothetical protein
MTCGHVGVTCYFDTARPRCDGLYLLPIIEGFGAETLTRFGAKINRFTGSIYCDTQIIRPIH